MKKLIRNTTFVLGIAFQINTSVAQADIDKATVATTAVGFALYGGSFAVDKWNDKELLRLRSAEPLPKDLKAKLVGSSYQEYTLGIPTQENKLRTLADVESYDKARMRMINDAEKYGPQLHGVGLARTRGAIRIRRVTMATGLAGFFIGVAGGLGILTPTQPANASTDVEFSDVEVAN